MAELSDRLTAERLALGSAERTRGFEAALKKMDTPELAGAKRALAERDMAAAAIARVRIKAESPEQLAGTLSGGNQQKVVLAKLLETGARILLCYDPTRGVDVGTKAELFVLLRELAASGYAILFYSTDLAELANVADRTLVLSYGRVAAVLSGEDVSEDRILAATMAGGASRGAPAA